MDVTAALRDPLRGEVANRDAELEARGKRLEPDHAFVGDVMSTTTWVTGTS